MRSGAAVMITASNGAFSGNPESRHRCGRAKLDIHVDVNVGEPIWPGTRDVAVPASVLMRSTRCGTRQQS